MAQEPPNDKEERTVEAIIAAILTLATIDTAHQHPPNDVIREYHLMRRALRQNGGVFAEPVINDVWGEPT
ncbi:MAG: hypothetical protein WBB34_17540 [Xanthobacteraceae bacterium]